MTRTSAASAGCSSRGLPEGTRNSAHYRGNSKIRGGDIKGLAYMVRCLAMLAVLPLMSNGSPEVGSTTKLIRYHGEKNILAETKGVVVLDNGAKSPEALRTTVVVSLTDNAAIVTVNAEMRADGGDSITVRRKVDVRVNTKSRMLEITPSKGVWANTYLSAHVDVRPDEEYPGRDGKQAVVKLRVKGTYITRLGKVDNV